MAETFGCTSLDGKTALTFGEGIRACKFTSGSAGELGKITCYVKQEGVVTPLVKCAIYDSSQALVANGTTEEHEVGEGQDDWMDFVFGTRPSVAASTIYWLAFYHETSVQLYRGPGGSNQYKYRSVVYGDWPDPLIGMSYSNYELAIYVTYYEAPPAVKAIVQATLISIPPLVILPRLAEILKFAT